MIDIETVSQNLAQTAKLFNGLVKYHDRNPCQPLGSLLSDAVYDFNYTDLGTLLSEMFVLWEDAPMFDTPLEPLDGHNGFEEFFVHVLDHQLTIHGVLERKRLLDPVPHEQECFRADKLHTLWTAMLAQERGDWKAFRSITKILRKANVEVA